MAGAKFISPRWRGKLSDAPARMNVSDLLFSRSRTKLDFRQWSLSRCRRAATTKGVLGSDQSRMKVKSRRSFNNEKNSDHYFVKLSFCIAFSCASSVPYASALGEG